MMGVLVKVEGSISPNKPELVTWGHEVVKVDGGMVHAKDKPTDLSASFRINLDCLGKVVSDSSPRWFRKIIWLLDPSALEMEMARINVLTELAHDVSDHIVAGEKMQRDLASLFRAIPVGDMHNDPK